MTDTNDQPNQDPASQLLALDKKKKLAQLEMPGQSTAPTAAPAPAAADTGAPGYTDPDTGETREDEPGAEEGDLYSDYVMPIKSMFQGGLVSAGRIVANKGLNAIKNRMPGKPNDDLAAGEESPTLDYAAMDNPAAGPGSSGRTLRYGARGQMGAGNTTDATNGFHSGSGVKVRN